jgi:hypothetical protein
MSQEISPHDCPGDAGLVRENEATAGGRARLAPAARNEPIAGTPNEPTCRNGRKAEADKGFAYVDFASTKR